MINVLLLAKDSQPFDPIELALNQITGRDYKITKQTRLTDGLFVQASFDAILVVQSSMDSLDEELTWIAQIIGLELPAPIILIPQQTNLAVDRKALSIGASECIPLSEITPRLLDRLMYHAISRKNAEAKLSFLATHDQLTGLANRYLFHEHLEKAIGVAKRNQGVFGLLFLDLDNFKTVNDSLGHDIGDILLIEVANRLREVVRETDIIAKIGGDEFTVLVEDINSTSELSIVAQKIHKVMESVYAIHGNEFYVTTSIGIAHFPECGLEPKTLMKSADIAMFKAKEFGRNQFHFYTNGLNEEARMRLELEKNLRRALINKEFEVYLQPQIRASDNQLCGAEALLRWNHPSIGVVSPASFLPILEEIGLMVSVERWLINEVCCAAKELIAKYGSLRFAVNISGSHFIKGDLKQSIYMALQKSGLAAKYLELELTEDIMIEHVERNNNLLAELSDLGVTIALDDFGTGYSSLRYLKNFPADVLKIDKAFIDNILVEPRESAIVEALISLSHELGICVVAEGVEQEAQVKHLNRIGCDFIQGYYFSKPLPFSDFEDFMKNHSSRVKNQAS